MWVALLWGWVLFWPVVFFVLPRDFWIALAGWGIPPLGLILGLWLIPSAFFAYRGSEAEKKPPGYDDDPF
jgi:hypothetical protein